jgi:hypothetical protein
LTNIDQLAAFDPKKIALLLQNLPDGVVVYGLSPTGVSAAWPRPTAPHKPVSGGIYYCEDQIEIWSGESYVPIAKLAEWDGKPYLLTT